MCAKETESITVKMFLVDVGAHHPAVIVQLLFVLAGGVNAVDADPEVLVGGQEDDAGEQKAHGRL